MSLLPLPEEPCSLAWVFNLDLGPVLAPAGQLMCRPAPSHQCYLHSCVHVHVYTHICVDLCSYMRVCMFVQVCVRAYTCVHVCSPV